MSHCHHLLRLAESWRTKAENLRQKYGAISPNLVNHVAEAFEICAEQLEDEIRREVTPPAPPQPIKP